MKAEFVSYEKMSKKQKREYNNAKRVTWTMSPVTRRPENPKAYNRCSSKISARNEWPL